MREAIDAELSALLGWRWLDHPYVLITGHRREHFGKGFDEICGAIASLAQAYHSSVEPTRVRTLRWLRLRIPTVTDRAPIGLSNGSGVISQECKPARELDDVCRLTAHRIRPDPGASAGVTRRCCPGVVSRQL